MQSFRFLSDIWKMQPVSEATAYVIFSGKHPVRNDGTREANGPLKGRLSRGISVAFPGQIQPAYALAYILRRSLPHLHITVGGPAMTQILKRQTPDVLVLSIEK